MVKNIFDIGSGRYQFDKKTLNSFLEESRNRPLPPEAAEDPGAGRAAGQLSDREQQGFFEEVMALYHDYMICQNVEVLLRLKLKLEEFSVRCNSHVLAAEVLNINSCLPYELRLRGTGTLPGKNRDEPDNG